MSIMSIDYWQAILCQSMSIHVDSCQSMPIHVDPYQSILTPKAEFRSDAITQIFNKI